MQVGWIQSFSGFFTYFIVMYDFGFLTKTLPALALLEGWTHNEGDMWDPDHPTLGNTNVKGCTDGEIQAEVDSSIPDWLFLRDLTTDLRMVYLKCDAKDQVVPYHEWGECHVKQLSTFSLVPVCYTTEALKYAQTAFLFSIVMQQYLNAWVCKTRSLSLLYQGLRNYFMIFGQTTETLLMFSYAYIHFVNVAFGTRGLIFWHFGIPGLPFSILQLIYAEGAKYFIRNCSVTQPKYIREG